MIEELLHPEFGTIAVIQSDNLPFDVHDVGELVPYFNPAQSAEDSKVFYVPRRSDILARFNTNTDELGEDKLPQSFGELSSHMMNYTNEIRRFASLGGNVLRRNTYVIEHVPPAQNALALTVVERLQGDTRTLRSVAHLNSPENEEINYQAIANAFRYYNSSDPDMPIIHAEPLTGQGQYAAIGKFLDYDPYLQHGRDMLYAAFSSLAYWVKNTPGSSRKTSWQERIDQAITHLYK